VGKKKKKAPGFLYTKRHQTEETYKDDDPEGGRRDFIGRTEVRSEPMSSLKGGGPSLENEKKSGRSSRASGRNHNNPFLKGRGKKPSI